MYSLKPHLGYYMIQNTIQKQVNIEIVKGRFTNKNLPKNIPKSTFIKKKKKKSPPIWVP